MDTLNSCATLIVDPDRPGSVYQQLFDQLLARIQSGQIRHGERLPASRQLAQSLGVSRRVVVTVYETLIAEGVLEARRGDGTYCIFESGHSARSPLGASQSSQGGDRRQDGLEKAYSIQTLSPKAVDSGALSLKAWSAASARAQKKLTATQLFNAIPGGMPGLKENLARYLLRIRGLDVSPSQIIVTAGIRESLDLVSSVLDPIRTIALEDPLNHRVRALLQDLRSDGKAQIVTLPVDDQGARVTQLADYRAVDAVHLTPSHQYPIGTTLSFKRREALISRLKATNCWVLENDYGAAIRYAGPSIKTLFEMDRRGRTLYFGTLSTILFANLHVSFVVVPENLVDAFVRVQERDRSLVSILAQAALCEFMESGAFGHHLLELRKRSKANYSSLFEEVERQLEPWLMPLPVTSGQSFCALATHSSFDDLSVVQEARKRGLGPTALSSLYFSPEEQRPGLVFGFAGVPAHQARDVVSRLRDSIQHTLGRTS